MRFVKAYHKLCTYKISDELQLPLSCALKEDGWEAVKTHVKNITYLNRLLFFFFNYFYWIDFAYFFSFHYYSDT